jgi:hypothetical protein
MEFVHDRFFDQQARIDHERGWAPALDKLVAHVDALRRPIATLIAGHRAAQRKRVPASMSITVPLT